MVLMLSFVYLDHLFVMGIFVHLLLFYILFNNLNLLMPLDLLDLLMDLSIVLFT